MVICIALLPVVLIMVYMPTPRQNNDYPRNVLSGASLSGISESN